MSDFPILFTSEEIDTRMPAHETIRPSVTTEAPLAVEEAKKILRSTYPKLLTKIELIWGYKECEQELDKLIVSSRDGRQGFPDKVLNALLALHKTHQCQFGTFKKLDPWDYGYLR